MTFVWSTQIQRTYMYLFKFLINLSKIKVGILHGLRKPVNKAISSIMPLVFVFGAAFSFWLESNFFGGWLGIGIVSNLLLRSREVLILRKGLTTVVVRHRVSWINSSSVCSRPCLGRDPSFLSLFACILVWLGRGRGRDNWSRGNPFHIIRNIIELSMKIMTKQLVTRKKYYRVVEHNALGFSSAIKETHLAESRPISQYQREYRPTRR